ncbi:phage portal protein [Mammaliicoccus sciuri]|uniref:phage portal protein n=1 Tax=Mammaliicoccus sciuri TaxID=1296 RepID=UPI001E4E012E|nr:phage portal protein [Mammaliicoccus sciuri]
MINIIWPNEKPLGERLTDMVKPNYETQEEMIVRLIEEHEKNIERISIGQKYYENDSDINRIMPKVDVDGKVDPLKPDWRINTNFHKNLVDQKVSYMAGNPITYKAENEQAIEEIHKVFDNRWDNKLIDILTAASNKGIEWVMPYVNEDGEFKIFRVPAEQAVPIWTNKEREDLSAFIRVYTLNEEKKVEYWTKDSVTYYVMEYNQLIPDYYHGEDNVQPHYYEGNKAVSWGKVPFIPFKNNPEETSDLFMYKSILDAIDKRLSDLQNTFDESTELIYVLKGYEGQNLDEFMKNLKYYKAINVDSEGNSGVDTIQVEVPMQSTKEYLEMMRAYVIEFGQGVDFQTDKFGNAPSGISLQFLFSNLRLKTNKLKNKTEVALQDLLDFIVHFHKINIDPNDIEITFNYDVLMNKLEESQIAMNSTGIISRESVVEHHPWVKDPVGEMERIQAEQLEYGSLEDGGDDETR